MHTTNPTITTRLYTRLTPMLGTLRTLDTPARRRLTLALIMLAALIGLQLFNFSTTEYALLTLFGDARLAGIPWATLLALTFTVLDLTALVRLFSPGQSAVRFDAAGWYLLGAWFLTATLNATLTWWTLALVIAQHAPADAILTRAQLLATAPIFFAALVWLARLFIVGGLSLTGDLTHTLRPALALTPSVSAVTNPTTHAAGAFTTTTRTRRLQPAYNVRRTPVWQEVAYPGLGPGQDRSLGRGQQGGALPIHTPHPPQTPAATRPAPRPSAQPARAAYIPTPRQPARVTTRPAATPHTIGGLDPTARVQPTPRPDPRPSARPTAHELQYEDFDDTTWRRAR